MNQSDEHKRFTELLWAHHTQLFGYLYALVHDVNDAEDLYQETIAVLWTKFDEYREGTSFFSWARTIARYKMLNFVRDRKNRPRLSEDLESTVGRCFDAFDADLLQARLTALHDCKERLAEEDRGLVNACYGSDRNLRQTAEMLGRSPKSVYDALERIRGALMKCIKARLAERERGT
jgi:RNA polymerase sigma-70 factor, ECF subfamily